MMHPSIAYRHADTVALTVRTNQTQRNALYLNWGDLTAAQWICFALAWAHVTVGITLLTLVVLVRAYGPP